MKNNNQRNVRDYDSTANPAIMPCHSTLLK